MNALYGSSRLFVNCRSAAVFISIVASAEATAEVWQVEFDPDTTANRVAAVVERAASGDTILVGPGTYKEHIDVGAKSLVFLSTHGPQETIFDGSNPADEGERGIIYKTDGVDDDLWLQGFTFQNGRGSTDNFGHYVGGGAINWWSVGKPVLVHIENCVFRDNEIDDISSLGGGAILVSAGGRLDLISCSFSGNLAVDVGNTLVIGIDHMRLEQCVFEMEPRSGIGPEIYAFGSDAIISGNAFINEHRSYEGLLLNVSFLRTTVAGNRFEDRTGSFATSMLLGPNLGPDQPTYALVFANNVVWNDGSDVGALFLAWNRSVVEFIGNTLINAGLHWNSPAGTITCNNNIFVRSPVELESLRGGDVFCNDSWPDSLTEGSTDGPFELQDNISGDPLFCDPSAGDLTIAFGSPCAPGNAPDGCGLIGAFGPACGTAPAVERMTWGQIKARHRR